MTQLVLFLEEPSAREMLTGLLPRMLPPGIAFRCVVFEGKQDLEKRLLPKLRGWQAADTLFVVLRDKDQGDCTKIKGRLTQLCSNAGRPETLVRIACHELESWYLGDLRAVERGLEINGLAPQQGKAKYKNPDRLANPFQELQRLTGNRYQKVSGSRNIGPHLSLERNSSHSFSVFVSGIRRLICEAT
ncbi:DUF4276 family protein [Thiocapsa rosea]|uniref:Uncharacterized protein DUF4276 n=1 Tax=Thiocapsa rosea TaxID=69360 RepID=A0A495V9A1_9GAMM|nr:DUF4276 family protein [Thiocapsa rosea]RKT45320.1 uncharacterized protein DUF4276 [Thiocapsa rosea]